MGLPSSRGWTSRHDRQPIGVGKNAGSSWVTELLRAELEWMAARPAGDPSLIRQTLDKPVPLGRVGRLRPRRPAGSLLRVRAELARATMPPPKALSWRG